MGCLSPSKMAVLSRLAGDELSTRYGVSGGFLQPAVPHRDDLRTGAQSVEQHGVGTGQETLGAKPFEGREKCGPPTRIEVSGNFVQQQKRRDAGHSRYQAGVGE